MDIDFLKGDDFLSMSFLYFLEDLRNPVLDVIMQIITHFGEELLFMAVAMLFIWCIDKKQGYYLLTVGFLGTQINQLLKVTFRIERPWVRDPDFTIVESARAEATGYSFPSGHTQSSVGTFGGIARITKRRWLKILSAAMCLLVPLSRMYLGVHTLWDTSVSFVIALALVFLLYPVITKSFENPKTMRILFGIMIAWCIGQVLFMELFPFPAEANGEELYSALKNAYKMLGAVLGFYGVYELDQKYIRYDAADGSVWSKLIRWGLGLAATVAVQKLCYLVFGLLPGEHGALFCRLLSYMVMVLFAGAVWPLTFPLIKKIAK